MEEASGIWKNGEQNAVHDWRVKTNNSDIHGTAIPERPPLPLTTELPTVAGGVPSPYATQFAPGALPEAETIRLPRPGERDPIANLARSTLLELDESLPPARRFIIRLRRRGYLRGCVLIVVARLRAVIADEIARQLSGGEDAQR